ncbi:hypothetical protein [Acidithiobacillus ferridurans]|nr:hypothetical protein [Acidithiobacillus ferridurans]
MNIPAAHRYAQLPVTMSAAAQVMSILDGFHTRIRERLEAPCQ